MWRKPLENAWRWMQEAVRAGVRKAPGIPQVVSPAVGFLLVIWKTSNVELAATVEAPGPGGVQGFLHVLDGLLHLLFQHFPKSATPISEPCKLPL